MKNKKPNVIVFFTDQQRWDTTGLHGNPLNLTPNYDRLARAGTHMKYSFTCQPVCGPARACLQTGEYPTSLGCWANGKPLPKDRKNLGMLFKEAGYDTGYIGKWHLSEDEHLAVPAEDREGYDYWLGCNLPEFSSSAYECRLYDNDGKNVLLPGYRVDAQADAMIRYISQPRDKSFFLFTSFIEPHHQNHDDNYPAPDGYEELYRAKWMPADLQALGGSSAKDIAGYCGMIKRVDEALGRIYDALKSLSMLDNTIIVFTCDHACHFKTRNNEYKRSCHESSIRTPAFFYGGDFMGGGERDELFSLIDVPPTLLDACGIKIPETMQGRSIVPVINRETKDWQDDIFVQISETQIGRAIRTKRWKYSVRAADKLGWEAPDSDVYVEDFLYDLDADPYELCNLVDLDAYEKVRVEMRERMLARIKKAEGKTPKILPKDQKDAFQRMPFVPGSHLPEAKKYNINKELTKH